MIYLYVYFSVKKLFGEGICSDMKKIKDNKTVKR